MKENLVEKMLELQNDSAKLEAIVAYVKACTYSPDKDIILAIAGETGGTKEKAVREDKGDVE